MTLALFKLGLGLAIGTVGFLFAYFAHKPRQSSPKPPEERPVVKPRRRHGSDTEHESNQACPDMSEQPAEEEVMPAENDDVETATPTTNVSPTINASAGDVPNDNSTPSTLESNNNVDDDVEDDASDHGEIQEHAFSQDEREMQASLDDDAAAAEDVVHGSAVNDHDEDDDDEDDDFVHVQAPSLQSSWTEVNPLEDYLPEGRTFPDHYNIAIMGSQGVGKTTLITDLRALADLVDERMQALSQRHGNGGVELSDEELEQLEKQIAESTLKSGFTEADVVQRRQELIDNGHEVDRPGMGNDNRDPTPWCISENTTLWDLPGAGTKTWPADTCVHDMGLRHMSAVVVVVGIQEQEAVTEMVEALHEARVPIVMVQTHFDQYVESILRDEFVSWLKQPAPKQPSAFLSDDQVQLLIEQRRRELAAIYKLEDRDFVHCVNLRQEPADLAEHLPFQVRNYEMGIMHEHIFRVAHQAHD